MYAHTFLSGPRSPTAHSCFHCRAGGGKTTHPNEQSDLLRRPNRLVLERVLANGASEMCVLCVQREAPRRRVPRSISGAHARHTPAEVTLTREGNAVVMHLHAASGLDAGGAGGVGTEARSQAAR